jgi:hypothetical protein
LGNIGEWYLISLGKFLYSAFSYLKVGNRGGYMGKYVTVSVKIPVKVKEELDKYGIKPSVLLKKAIEQELRNREIQRIKGEVEEIKPILAKLPTEEVVKLIREDREQR